MLALALSAGAVGAQNIIEDDRDEIVIAQAKKRSSAPRHTGTHVYLLRGFMDIFSTGMDDLGEKLNRRGIRASVHGHGEYPSLASSIGDRYRRGIRENVVIIGHSLGANAAFQMAEELGRYKVNVPLIIAFDPTAPMTASSNVSRVVNFYSSTNGWGTSVGRGAGFRGTLSNVDLSRRGEIGHTDIDKSPSLHNQSISYIQSIGGGRASSDTPKPKSADKDKESKKSDETKAAAAGAPDSAKSTDAKAAAMTSGSSVPGPTANTGAKAKPADGGSDSASAPKPADGKPAPDKTAASPSTSTSN